jgi:hypothetical protein
MRYFSQLSGGDRERDRENGQDRPKRWSTGRSGRIGRSAQQRPIIGEPKTLVGSFQSEQKPLLFSALDWRCTLYT